MAGRITISTLNDDTGVLATQNGMSGIAKAWVNFNGASAVIRASFNVSSITYDGTGDYRVNFTTAMPNANYSSVVSGDVDLVGDFVIACLDQRTSGRTTTTVRVRIGNSSGGQANSSIVCVSVFS